MWQSWSELAAAVLIAVLLAAVPAGAATTEPVDLVEVRDGLEALEDEFASGLLPERRLEVILGQVANWRSSVSACALELEPRVSQIDAAIAAATTEEADGQPSDVPAELSRLNTEKASLLSRLTTCRLLVLRADQLSTKASAELRAIVTERLLHRGSTIWEAAVATARDPRQIIDAIRAIIVRGSGIDRLSRNDLFLILALGVLAVVVGLLVRSRIGRWFGSRTGDSLSARGIRCIGASFAHFLPALGLFTVTTLFSAQFHFEGAHTRPFAAHVSLALLIYTIALIIIRGVLAPSKPETQLTQLPDEVARSFARRGLLLIALMLVGQTVFVILDAGALPEDVRDLASSILATVLIINVCSLVWLVGYVPKLERSGRGIRIALILALAALLIGELMGFRTLTSYVLTGFIRTAVLLAAFIALEAVLGHLFASLDEGLYDWQKALRKSLSLEDDEAFPGLLLVRILTALMVWSTGLFLLLRIWGLSDNGTAVLMHYLSDGFEIGDVNIVPSKVLTGIMIFVFLMTGFRWFRNALEERWLTQSRLDAGSRETMVALTSYTGFAIAGIVGLTLAGVSFQNLAIIAGALSLGIGFGLQNIVNNFISGIILLFERPVRPGDWVVVGATEGYVKKVRVRSTEIQTFDRSDVIVPNSEFISMQVTNWTLRDPYGRVIVPVRVAFGSEPEKVRDLLLEIAREHPMVVQFGVVPAPIVLFMGFGDNFFTFELRCFIRDINWKLSVISDLYFAIEKAFREQGIKIPVPQMDMRMQPSSREAQDPGQSREDVAPGSAAGDPNDSAADDDLPVR